MQRSERCGHKLRDAGGLWDWKGFLPPEGARPADLFQAPPLRHCERNTVLSSASVFVSVC